MLDIITIMIIIVVIVIVVVLFIIDSMLVIVKLNFMFYWDMDQVKHFYFSSYSLMAR